MTQVFATNHASPPGFIGLPQQRPAPSWGHEPVLAVAMTAGKGVRAVQCMGCQRETLPRTDDGAPLCPRCCEVLAAPSRLWRPWRRKG